MVRTVGSVGEDTLKAIRRSAADLIAEHGYEAMNLRQLAALVGITAGSIYNYIGSKQDLLCGLLREVMEDLLDATDEFVLVQESSSLRLEAFVRLHIQFHLDRKNDVLIASTELRSLDPRNLRAIVKLRNRYEAILSHIIKEGCSEGAFRVADVKLTTLAILPMLTGVASWYRPGRRLSREALLDGYVDLCFKLLGASHAHEDASPAVPILSLTGYTKRDRSSGFGAKPRR